MRATPGPARARPAESFGFTETGTTQRLAPTRRTLLHAATRVMDAPHGGVAIPAGEVDDQALAHPPLGAPADRIEEAATDLDRTGQTTGGCLHFALALPAHGHEGSS